MGQHNKIVDFPGKKTMFKRGELKEELRRLREELLPFYEDDEMLLDEHLEKVKSSDAGAVGLMSAIAWCHGEIGIYRMLNDMQGDE